MKNILSTALLAAIMSPIVSFAVTLDEINDRLLNLEDELLITQDENQDLTREISNLMKVSGYVDVEYVASTKDGDSNGFRMHHLSLFFERKWEDNWHFFSEIEYEDAPLFESAGDSSTPVDTQEGKIYVEAVNLSYLWKSTANFRVGRFFTPAGIWSIDHYPPFVTTQDRPQHIRKIFPQLIAGGMAYGAIPLGNSFLNYEIYTGNGEGNTAKQDQNSSKAVGFKASFIMPYLDHFEIGGTYYSDKLNDGTQKTALGVHAKIKMNMFTLQSEYAKDEKDLSGSVIKSKGYYLQAFYDKGKYTLGVRHDYYDDNTSVANQSTKFGTKNSIFINYHVNEDIVLKLEHHMVNVESSASQDYNRTLVSIVAYLGS